MRIPRQRTTPPKAAARTKKVWTVEAIRQLGMTTDIETAASIFGIGRTLAYDLLKTNEFPVPPMRLGRRLLIPVPGILAALGADAHPVQPTSSEQAQ